MKLEGSQWVRMENRDGTDSPSGNLAFITHRTCGLSRGPSPAGMKPLAQGMTAFAIGTWALPPAPRQAAYRKFHMPFPQGSLKERQLEANQALHKGFIRLQEKPHCGLRSSRIVI